MRYMLSNYFFSHLLMRKRTLVYLGANKGGSLSKYVDKFDRIYAFEANPDLCLLLKEKFSNKKNVHIINAIVGEKDGSNILNIGSNLSTSSVGLFNEDFTNSSGGKLKMIDKRTVEEIYLPRFLKEMEVDKIDLYVSDIQGSDLTVLKSLSTYIIRKKIKVIISEVAKEKNIYDGLGSNSYDDFEMLLNKNYNCVSKGWGTLKRGEFKEVPETWWEFDCMWELK
ncbi:FkbM family methyltransferase [bacterium]|nr:MAG: FkbM family methyltransferase [bacterium]